MNCYHRVELCIGDANTLGIATHMWHRLDEVACARALLFGQLFGRSLKRVERGDGILCDTPRRNKRNKRTMRM